MQPVNNFITDLIDGMENNQADTLIITGGSYPYYLIAEKMKKLTTFGAIETAELVEDMEALGIFIKDDQNLSYSHISDNGEGRKWMLRLYTALSDRQIPSVVIRIVPGSIGGQP